MSPRRVYATYGFGKSFWTVVNPGDEPALLCLIHPGDTRPTQMLHELCQGDPAGGIHVQMLLVRDVLLIHLVCTNSLCPKSARGIDGHRFSVMLLIMMKRNLPSGKQCHKFMLELAREVCDVSASVLSHDEHLS